MSVDVKNFNELLQKNKITIAAAESVTAGLFASTIASAPGSASVLKGSIVTYNVDMKMNFLGVKKETLDTYTAESMETTREMVKGLQQAYKASSIYIAVTGVAAPGTPEYPVDKPVGQMYVCILFNGEHHEFETMLNGPDSNEIRRMAVDFMMERLYELVQG